MEGGVSVKQKLDFMLAALQAVPTDNYSVYIYCNDGSVRFMDMKPFLQDGTVFEPLKDIKVFRAKKRPKSIKSVLFYFGRLSLCSKSATISSSNVTAVC